MYWVGMNGLQDAGPQGFPEVYVLLSRRLQECTGIYYLSIVSRGGGGGSSEYLLAAGERDNK